MSSVGSFTTDLSLTLNLGQRQPLESTKVNQQHWYTNGWNESVRSKPNISSFWKDITSRCLSKIYQKTLNLLHWGAVLRIFLRGSSHGGWLGFPDSSRDGDTVGKADPKFRFNWFCRWRRPLERLRPGKHSDMREDNLPTSGFYAEQTHTRDKVPWKLWGKLWIFTLKEVNRKGWMFLHPQIAAHSLWILWKQCWVKWRFTESTKASVDGANYPWHGSAWIHSKASIPRAAVMPGKDRAHSSAPA